MARLRDCSCQLPADSLRDRQRKCGQGEELAEEKEEEGEQAGGEGEETGREKGRKGEEGDWAIYSPASEQGHPGCSPGTLGS